MHPQTYSWIQKNIFLFLHDKRLRTRLSVALPKRSKCISATARSTNPKTYLLFLQIIYHLNENTFSCLMFQQTVESELNLCNIKTTYDYRHLFLFLNLSNLDFFIFKKSDIMILLSNNQWKDENVQERDFTKNKKHFLEFSIFWCFFLFVLGFGAFLIEDELIHFSKQARCHFLFFQLCALQL